MIAIFVLLSLLYLGLFLPPIVVVGISLFLLTAEVWLEGYYAEEELGEETPSLSACQHTGEMRIFTANTVEGCEECIKNNYKWVHLRLCTSCGHVGCCDSSNYKHATKHFHATEHPIVASLESDETWAWCYVDEKFVPMTQEVSL